MGANDWDKDGGISKTSSAKTLKTFLNENIWDEIRIFKSPLNFKNGIKSPRINIKPKNRTLIVEDELLVIYNSN